MFTIIISEKGGAERREAFDKNEINVGRVQGNDLMLPKGNVSKHHARLLYRDGRFIVTDLKSTNGTYVNGRKISQATIVREGDKIYIGDFVMRLETPAAAGASPDASYAPPAAPADDSQGRAPARRDPTPAPPQAAPPGGPPPLPPQVAAQGSAPLPPIAQPPMQPVLGSLPAPAQGSAPAITPRNGPSLADQSVSHYPLERDPDDSESAPEMRGAPVPKVPGPPRVPQAEARGGRASAAQVQRATNTTAAPPVVRSIAPPGARASLPRETPQQAARRLALITLVDRVADVVDLSPLKRSPSLDEATSQQIDRAVREQAKAMREEGEAPEGIDLELLSRDALRELVGLGPVGPLLEDEETMEIHVSRPDYVLATRNGQPTLADPSFTSEEALARVVARLAHQAGEDLRPDEPYIERRLARGAHLVAIAPPAAGTWVLSIRKRRRIETTLEDLVRGAALSRGMAQFLEACLLGKANVLVVGSGPGVIATVLGALASAAPSGERVVVLQDADEIGIAQAQVVQLSIVDHGARGAEAVRAAARLGSDRLVVASLAGAVAAATIDAIAQGSEGVLAGVSAPSLRHGLSRLTSQVALASAGAPIEVGREAVGESFDIAIEVSRAGDGRIRISRVSELAGGDAKGVATRDLFVLSADGTGEAAFAATGTVPRVANDFAARGVKLDGAVFKRR
jgi:pilus assembly protein CpaF